MKKTLSVALILMIALAASAWGASAATGDCNVTPGEIIQDEIDLGTCSVVTVQGGEYNETIIIDGRDVSLVAVGDVTIRPTALAACDRGVIEIYDAVATIDGFIVDANYSQTGCLGGIYARSLVPSGGGPVEVRISNNEVRGFGKNGITVNVSGATATIRDNIVLGSGPLGPGNWAQNGIQLGYGATGAVMGNTVDSHWYTGDDWSACGILVFESNDAIVQGNVIRGSETALKTRNGESPWRPTPGGTAFATPQPTTTRW
jgi:nitrous oxidase accessory protein NosD